MTMKFINMFFHWLILFETMNQATQEKTNAGIELFKKSSDEM